MRQNNKKPSDASSITDFVWGKDKNIDKTIAENQITPLTQNGILKILPTNKPMRKTRSA